MRMIQRGATAASAVKAVLKVSQQRNRRPLKTPALPGILLHTPTVAQDNTNYKQQPC